MRVVLKRGNDQVVTMVGLRTTAAPPEYLNTAEVFATLKDQKDQIVPPFDDVPMAYVPGSNGNYEWEIDAEDSMLPKGVEYTLVFTAEQNGLNYRTVHTVSVVDA